jgi:hypothetical protein
MLSAQGTLVASELGFNQTDVVNFAESLLKVAVICYTEQFYKSVVVIFDLVPNLDVAFRLDVLYLVENYT